MQLRLLAAFSGVSVTIACAGRSERTLPERGTGGAHDAMNAGTGGTPHGSSAGTGGAFTDAGVGGTLVDGSGGSGNAPAIAGAGNVSGDAGSGGSAGTHAGAGGAGGSAGAGMGGSSGTTAGAGPHATLGCTDTGDFATGLTSCEGSFVHRASAVACPQSPHDDSVNAGGAAGQPNTSQAGDCLNDADCSSLGNAYCALPKVRQIDLTYYCVVSCETDSDCPSNQVCSCDDDAFTSVATGLSLQLGHCTSATCVTDSDCAPLLCIASTSDPCGPTTAANFHCQSPSDECSGAGDCPKPPSGASGCQLQNGKYACTSGQCGRPFLVAGAPRQSKPTETSTWRDATLPPVTTLNTLDPASRARIAEHFQNAALMEHASIAAFARFSLQLLALGAPPDLVADAARAMADETRHAELCFELASRYAGRDCGPGPLPLDGAFEAVDLASVVELAFVEGCVGETAAALEASFAAEAATDPLVQNVLQQIAHDEERHAALAFRFVSWALERDTRLFARLDATLRALAAAHASDARATEAPAPELAAHGVLSAEQHRAARAAALHAVVPALLASLEPGRPNVGTQTPPPATTRSV